VTPHGVALLATPFAEVSFAGQHRGAAPARSWSPLQLSLNGLLVSQASLRTVLVALAAVAALASLRRATLRPAHLILLAGGAVLLLRMQRFSVEYAQIALPLLGAFRPPSFAKGALPRGIALAGILLVSLLSLRYLAQIFDTRCAFPVCTRGLPDGAVAFLDRAGATGDVLNHPNEGGYLEWELYPRQKIFVDLQTPFLFPDGAIFAADQAFQDPVVLAVLIGSYAPAFLLVPNQLRGFASIAASFPDYAPVFVDDACVLYASASQNPDLVERNRLRAIDPFALAVTGPLRTRRRSRERLRSCAGSTRSTPAAVARVCSRACSRSSAATPTQHCVARTSSSCSTAIGQPNRLRADTLFRMRRFGDAADAYAVARAPRRRPEEPGAASSCRVSAGRVSSSWAGRRKRIAPRARRSPTSTRRASAGRARRARARGARSGTRPRAAACRVRAAEDSHPGGGSACGSDAARRAVSR
jgi:hypothetical protein